jgi:hypothetical protein
MPNETAVVTFNIAHKAYEVKLQQRGRTLVKDNSRARFLSPIPDLKMLKKKLRT